MYFTVSVSELLTALSVVKKAVKTSPLLPILENFLFEIKDNELTITASDQQTSIITSLPVQNTENGQIAVPARMLFSTLSLLPEKESITFNFDNSTYSLSITSAKGEYKLACENAADFPEVSMPPRTRQLIHMPAEILKKAFEQTMFAASQNENRPELDGVNIKIDQKQSDNKREVTFLAIGDNQLARYKRTDIQLTNHESNEAAIATSGEESLTIPTKSLQLLVQLFPLPSISLKDEVDIVFDENKACFSQGKTHIIARLVEGEFKSYESMIPSSEPQGTLTIDRDTFLKALKMMEVYANKTYRRIKLKLGSATDFEISAIDLNFSNEAKETHECVYQGQELEIGFDAKLLITMASKITSKEIVLRLYSAQTPASIKPVHLAPEEDLLFLLAPMLLTEPEF